ncbi:MAG: glycoside hydrolase family 97 N-terminal domain-containing protein, partial [Bacteroidales bacterium]|nr:glycoside hydrolase family 97 N-terminal domain-containing protein [Bacteroidales bacterium]
MKKVLLSISLFLGLLATASAQNSHTVTSPDGKIAVNVSEENGKPQYTVSYDGKTIIAPSALGVQTDFCDFSRGVQIANATPASEIMSDYSLPNIKQSNVHYTAKKMTVDFSKDENNKLSVEFRVSNRDVAFRYIIH